MDRDDFTRDSAGAQRRGATTCVGTVVVSFPLNFFASVASPTARRVDLRHTDGYTVPLYDGIRIRSR